MKPIYHIGAVILLTIALDLQGCVIGTNFNSAYISGQVQHEQTVCFGTVDPVRNIVIDREQTGVGIIAGGTIGGTGSAAAISRGNGSVAVGVLDAILGSVAGNAFEGQMNKWPGLEIIIKLDNGEYRAVTQNADEAFRPGERVCLLSSGGITRVTH